MCEENLLVQPGEDQPLTPLEQAELDNISRFRSADDLEDPRIWEAMIKVAKDTVALDIAAKRVSED